MKIRTASFIFFIAPVIFALSTLALANEGLLLRKQLSQVERPESANSLWANVEVGGYGIQGYGKTAGGYFLDSNSSGYGYAGVGNYGIAGYGNTAGGSFADLDGSGSADVGTGDYGIRGFGNLAGGYFADLDGSGYGYAGVGDYGIQGYGNHSGGHFKDLNGSGEGWAGKGGYGIQGHGDKGGGAFLDPDNGGWANVGYGTYKIYGGGSVSFVQNHPENIDQVVVYAAPEGDEVATYTRGEAKLVNGEARITLGETFKWVTNPDIGLTAHLTPQGRGTVLFVASKTTEELVVRSMEGFPDDVAFDYIVYGLRIGFEESSIVQEKTREAYIPSMKNHRDLYVKQPELRQYNALERFGRMRADRGMTAMPDMHASETLQDAIEEFNPEIHKLPHEKSESPPRLEIPPKPDPGA